MNPLRIFLVAALILVVFGVQDASAGKAPIWKIDYDESKWSLISMSGDGEYIVSAHNNDIYLFNKNSSSPIWTFEQEACDSIPCSDYTLGRLVKLEISSNGEHIVAEYSKHYWETGPSFNLTFFNTDSNEPVWINSSYRSVSALSISSDGQYIVEGDAGYGGLVRFFSKDSNVPIWSYSGIRDDPVHHQISITDDMTFSPDSLSILKGDSVTWTNNDDMSHTVTENEDFFDSGNIDPGETWSFTFTDVKSSDTFDYKCSYHSSMTGQINIGYYQTSVQGTAITSDGEYIVVASHREIFLFEKDSNIPSWTYTISDSHLEDSNTIESIEISSNGNYLIARINSTLYYFDNEGELLWNSTLEGHITSIDFSSNEEFFAITHYNAYPPNGLSSLLLFETDSNIPSLVWNFSDIVGSGRAYVSGNGTHIVVFGENTYLFDQNSNVPIWTLNSYAEDYSPTSEYGGGISDDGEYIALGGREPPVFGIYLFNNHKPPVVTIDSITPSPAIFCREITFNGSSSDEDGTIVVYAWSVESGLDKYWSFSDKEDFVYSCYDYPYLFEREYIITFRAYDDDGDWAEDSTLLVIIPNQKPTAIIDSISPSPARFDDEITFNGTGSDSDSNISSYEWFSCLSSPDNPSISDCTGWGEGEPLFLSDLEDFSAQVFYNDDWPGDSAAGTHFILFRVCDDDGGCSEAITTLIVNPNSHPNVINSIEPNPTEKGTAVFFNGTGSDSDGTIVAYLWESTIDGELSTEANFSSNNLSLGHHTITFQVQDNDGDWSSIHSSLFVFTYPVAIAGQDSTGTPGVPLQFSGAGTDEDGTVVLYEWDFDGDGIFEWSSTENGRELNIYNNEGTYTATLRVTDNDGFTGTDTVEITISEKKVQIDDEGNVTVTDAGEDEEGIPSISMIPALISIGLIARYRRK